MNEQYDFNKTSTYDYELPKELIAQDPVEPRDAARLLVVGRNSFRLEHRIFRDLAEYLRPGDRLVLNDTKVLPARINGVKKCGGAKCEIFFLRPSGGDNAKEWVALVRPGRKLPAGTSVTIGKDTDVVVEDRLADGLRKILFPSGCDPFNVIHEFGETPLPHYITDTHSTPDQYQTVYARDDKENSVASPTAGLHFTKELLAKVRGMGASTAFVTLQVGLGTFRPVKTENIAEHVMHDEFCEITEDTVRRIYDAKKNGGRIIAVGTTVVRTLESFAKEYGVLKPGILDTRLFITPGFEFKVVDALITNFHLPKSTLMMLVAAFGGYETIMAAYKEAVEKRYRFFSFGDAMFIC